MLARWQALFPTTLPPQPKGTAGLDCGLRFSPLSSGTDGFYIAILQKRS
jgi:16S rRNA C967 or C1407 C5-methylase (RsmB/RsmF family)